MKIARIVMLSALLFGSTPFIAGCDKTVKEEEKKTVDDKGTVTKDKVKETVDSNGNHIVDESHSVVPSQPARP